MILWMHLGGKSAAMEGIREAVRSVDYNALKWATEWTASSTGHTAFTYITAELLIFILPLVVLYLWEVPPRTRADKFGPKKAAVLAMLSVTLGLAAKTLLAVIMFRNRPFIAHPDLSFLELHVDTNSFPSSHAMIAFAVAASLYLSGYRKRGTALGVIAVVIAVGRVFSGVHYPTDVLAGALVGIGAAWYLHREASSIRRYLPDK